MSFSPMWRKMTVGYKARDELIKTQMSASDVEKHHPDNNNEQRPDHCASRGLKRSNRSADVRTSAQPIQLELRQTLPFFNNDDTQTRNRASVHCINDLLSVFGSKHVNVSTITLSC